MRRWVTPRSGSALAGGEDRVDVHRRLPHPHEDDVVDRFDAAEVERLVEDLVGAEVAAELHLAGGAEGAGQRAARLRGEADRAPPVAVAHQHRLDRPAVGGVEERLDRAVVGLRLGLDGQRRERHRRRRAARAAPPAGSSSPRRSAPRARPTPRPGRRGRRARRPRRGLWRAARGPRLEFDLSATPSVAVRLGSRRLGRIWSGSRGDGGSSRLSSGREADGGAGLPWPCLHPDRASAAEATMPDRDLRVPRDDHDANGNYASCSSLPTRRLLGTPDLSDCTWQVNADFGDGSEPEELRIPARNPTSAPTTPSRPGHLPRSTSTRPKANDADRATCPDLHIEAQVTYPDPPPPKEEESAPEEPRSAAPGRRRRRRRGGGGDSAARRRRAAAATSAALLARLRRRRPRPPRRLPARRSG